MWHPTWSDSLKALLVAARGLYEAARVQAPGEKPPFADRSLFSRERFAECIAEKNCTLIRYGISQSLRKLFDTVQDERIRETALHLIDTEKDLKYRKKYASLWRGK